MDKEHWFTEPSNEGGSAFSLKIKGKLHDEQTPHQRIEVYATETFGNLMVIDGFVMLTSRDNFIYHEMMSHPALFTHPAPGNVVIIGGGDCGTLREVLRHRKVNHVLQVEIDARVTRLSEQFFPELCESNNDARAGFLFSDGIRWMNHAESGKTDVIIVDSTDPIGPAEGLFSEDFYRDCHAALDEHGILIQQSESPLYHMDIIRSMREAMLGAGFEEVRTLFFPQPCYPSGWWSATLAGKAGSLNNFRKEDAENKLFQTNYYNAEIHTASFSTPEFLKQALE